MLNIPLVTFEKRNSFLHESLINLQLKEEGTTRGFPQFYAMHRRHAQLNSPYRISK